MAGTSSETKTIVLATVVPVTAVVVIVLVVWRVSRARRQRLFNRGITPIGDDEIESWKADRHTDDEKAFDSPARSSTKSRSRHQQQNSSVSSVRKPASVIVYRDDARVSRVSGEESPKSLRHWSAKPSMDLPQTPILARAPNARPGLTDETIQGDEAFIPQLKRQHSRLAKSQSTTSSPRHSRHRSSRSHLSTVSVGNRDRWYGYNAPDYTQMPSRQSADDIHRTPLHQRFYSSTSNPPRRSFDESIALGGLSPRPALHQSDIGRAIG